MIDVNRYISPRFPKKSSCVALQLSQNLLPQTRKLSKLLENWALFSSHRAVIRPRIEQPSVDHHPARSSTTKGKEKTKPCWSPLRTDTLGGLYFFERKSRFYAARSASSPCPGPSPSVVDRFACVFRCGPRRFRPESGQWKFSSTFFFLVSSSRRICGRGLAHFDWAVVVSPFFSFIPFSVPFSPCGHRVCVCVYVDGLQGEVPEGYGRGMSSWKSRRWRPRRIVVNYHAGGGGEVWNTEEGAIWREPAAPECQVTSQTCSLVCCLVWFLSSSSRLLFVISGRNTLELDWTESSSLLHFYLLFCRPLSVLWGPASKCLCVFVCCAHTNTNILHSIFAICFEFCCFTVFGATRAGWQVLHRIVI